MKVRQFEKIKDVYIKSRGTHCLYCKSEDITAGEHDADADYISQYVSCNECEKCWIEIYKLDDVIEY